MTDFRVKHGEGRAHPCYTNVLVTALAQGLVTNGCSDLDIVRL